MVVLFGASHVGVETTDQARCNLVSYTSFKLVVRTPWRLVDNAPSLWRSVIYGHRIYQALEDYARGDQRITYAVWHRVRCIYSFRYSPIYPHLDDSPLRALI